MENASKALIIAGAILLSILIIALGIYVYNMAAGTIGANPFDEMEVSNFNTPLEQYESNKILGSSVRKLIDKLIANAGTNKDSVDKLPDINYIDETGKGPQVGNNVNNSTSYGNNANIVNTKALNGRGVSIISDVDKPSVPAMSRLKLLISNSHYYKVSFEYNDTTSLIEVVNIDYNP